jgi:transcriptional regulator with XRE-family HTH domain
MDTIGNRLNGLLSEHDLSQRDLSAEINVAHSTISRIISGNVIPSGRVLIELADYFCVSIDWLVGRE